MFNAKEGNTMAKTYTWAVDAGHEWLAVKISELVELGIQDDITEYSYVKGGTAYLEGDCDAATFINAYTAKNGTAPKTKQGKVWDVQPLRRFARYTASKANTITKQDVMAAINTESLDEYMSRVNRWLGMFQDHTELKFPLDQKAVNKIVDQLNGDLSPENLHCDGEISAAEAGRRYRFYQTVAQELEAYCKNNKLTMKEVYEL